jgi:Mg2+/Co2+ transporter CorB
MLHEGGIVTKGDVTIRDLNRQLNWSLPDDEAATIAGLVIHETQIIPDVGQIFIFYGYKFEVLQKEHNQITELRVTALEN